jgi:PAS domain S-box-containing protein
MNCPFDPDGAEQRRTAAGVRRADRRLGEGPKTVVLGAFRVYCPPQGLSCERKGAELSEPESDLPIASELQFRLLAEHASDIVARTSLRGVVEWISPSVEAMLGWTSSELVGRPMLSLVAPHDHGASKVLQDALLRGGTATADARLANRTGGWRWMSARVGPLRHDDGRVIGRVVSLRDADEQHQAQERLRQREAQFRLLAENSSDVVVSLDNQGVMGWASPSLTEQLGWLPEELVGRNNGHLLHPDDAPVATGAQQAILRGEHGSSEARFLTRSGQYVWMSVAGRPVRDAVGNVVGRVEGWRNVDAEHLVRDELRASQERLRMLVELGSDVVVEGDNSGVITWITASIRGMLGWEPTAMIGRPVMAIVHPDDVETIRRAQREVLSGHEPRFEIRFCRPDGSPKWFAVVVRPMLDDDGDIVGRVAGWRDIDAERTAREQLERSEEQMRFLMENASDVVVQQVDGVIEFISPAITRMLGWDPADFIGTLATEFWHPDDRAAAATLRHDANHGNGGTTVLRMRHLDGEYRWVEIVARPAPQADGRSGAVGVLRDVTERVLAEQQADEARERDRVIAELSSDVYALFSPEGTIEWITGATVELLGAQPSELLGMSGGDIFLLDDPDAAIEARGRLLRGEHLSGLVRIRRLDGTLRWIDRRSRALLDADGSLLHFATAWRDAQHDVELRETLAASERAAKDANLAKTTFLSRMSHELRTPLNAVLGFAQLLDMDELTDEQHAAVAQIMSGGRHLLDLINEVLDIARIESGRMSMSPEVVMASDVVGEAMELVRAIADGADVSIVGVDQVSCREFVFVDRQRTIQVLLNLLSNAIKYNRPGGAVHVRCRHESPGELHLDVVDEGFGIDPAHLPRLFEPFDRLGAEATDVEGTGIGLALSRGLAEMMGGRIEVESLLGRGSTFTLVLPTADAESLALPDDVDQADADGVSTTSLVLSVEDNPANAMLMRSVVARRHGVVLREATTGADALASAFQQCPDVVLLDLHLPDMRGEEVLRRLRSDPRTATVPVVVISADAGPDVRSRLSEMGADAFLPKPADIAAVMSWIDHPMQARGVQ